MKKSISTILLILTFAAGMAWAETAKEWCEKGTIAMEIGYYNVAIKFFEKALAINPNDSESCFNMGLVYSKKGKPKEAISYYKKAIAIDPGHASAHFNIRCICNKKGDNSVAAHHFYKAGSLYLKQGDKEGALKAYEGLKATKSKELEQALFERLYPELKQKESESSR